MFVVVAGGWNVEPGLKKKIWIYGWWVGVGVGDGDADVVVVGDEELVGVGIGDGDGVGVVHGTGRMSILGWPGAVVGVGVGAGDAVGAAEAVATRLAHATGVAK